MATNSPAVEKAAAATTSFWDRATQWASEHKAVVYSIAGVAVVVTGAGAVYYFSDSKPSKPAEPRKSKKERRKEKKRAEEEKRINLKDEEAGMVFESARSMPINNN